MDSERAREDRELAARVNAGDPTALEAIYNAYAAAVYRQALAVVGSRADAEDVVQEVFLNLVRRDGRPIRELKAYLLTAARHQACSLLRQRRRQEPEALLLAMPHEGAWTPPMERQMVREALEALPAEQREVVMLKVFEQWTFEEIGQSLKASINTVASRYRYALKKLRQVLGDSGHG